MKEKEQNTDHIVRDILHNSEANPSADAWQKLHKDLDIANKNHKIFVYRRILAVAAVTLILLVVGIIYFLSGNKAYENEIAEKSLYRKETSGKIKNNNHETENNVREAKENQKLKRKQTSSEKKNRLKKEKHLVFEPSKNITIANGKKEEKQELKLQKVSSRFIKPEYQIDLKLTLLPNNQNRKPDINKTDILKYSDEWYADNSLPDENAKESKWAVGGNFSPILLNSSNNTRSDYAVSNAAFVNSRPDAETPAIAYSGGLDVNYSISEKWSLQSGVYYLKQGYEVEDFVVLKNSFENTNSSSSNTNIGNISFNNPDKLFDNEMVINETNYGFDVLAIQFDSYLLQSIEFLEIPFVLKYHLFDKKTRIYILGGFNAGFLIGNNVYLENNNSSIGKTDGINSLIYKSIIGFIVEYPLSKKISLSLSPTYKYQLNSINKNMFDGMHLQYFDFKTGINYKL